MLRWVLNGRRFEYEPTAEDRAELARAVTFEGPPRRAVAWTLVQRFCLLFPGGRYPSLAQLVRAYCQPINPRWFPDGDLYQIHARSLPTENERADARKRAERRPRQAATPLDALPAEAVGAADEALGAVVESPVLGSVHFRAAPRAARGRSRASAFRRAQQYAASREDLLEPVRGIPEGYGERAPVNWFFTTPQSMHLRVVPAGEELPVTHDPMAPPPNMPQGPGWAWAWVYVPALHSLAMPANENAAERTEAVDQADEADADTNPGIRLRQATA